MEIVSSRNGFDSVIVTIDSISTSVRFNWIYSLGSDIYIAYDELRDDDFLALDPALRHAGRVPWVQHRQLAIQDDVSALTLTRGSRQKAGGRRKPVGFATSSVQGTRPCSGARPSSMAIYQVTARFKTDMAPELRRRLDDGSIAAQQPDGQEMVDSLHRAVVSESGDVRWRELCYCDPPLAHERATILDHYFDDIVTLPIEDYQEYEGRPFMEYLEAQRSC